MGEIRNVRTATLIGHNGSGKSLLLARILYKLNMIDKPETKYVDYDPVEEEKGASFSSHVAAFEWKGKRMFLIDTPGFADFISEVINGIFIAENVISVVNAVAGVEIQTERTWNLAEEMKKPIMVFVNQMDKERANFDNVVAELKERFSKKILPLVVPIGAAESFEGVVDLLKKKAYRYKGEELVEEDMPSEFNDLRSEILEDIVEQDEELMMRYLDGEEIEYDELMRALKESYRKGEVVPVIAGSGLKEMGVEALLDYLESIGVSPAEASPYKAAMEDGKEVEIPLSEEEPFCAYIFKSVVDQFVGRITFAKVIAGTLKNGDTIVNVQKDTSEKVGHVYLPVLKQQKEVESVGPGEIVVLLKLKEGAVGETLAHKDRRVKIVVPSFPEPMFSRSVHPKSKSDIDKISGGLSRLSDSDPTFVWEYDPETGETVISGLGAMHLDVMVERLKRIFGVDVEIGRPKIAYRETITAAAVAEHKHKKQTGGHGQYGHVKIQLEPLPRGQGYEFVDKIVGGVIPRNFIPSVDKGIREAMKKGVLAGYPVTDVRVILFDGSYHEVDSSDISFQIAAIQAFKKGMEAAKPVILEPIMEVEVFVPEENAGDVMGEISSRRGRPLGMEPSGKGMVKVKAEVPLAEMLDFSNKLSSITSGRGYFTMKFQRYEIVPPNIQEKIIEERRREMQEQEK